MHKTYRAEVKLALTEVTKDTQRNSDLYYDGAWKFIFVAHTGIFLKKTKQYPPLPPRYDRPKDEQ